MASISRRPGGVWRARYRDEGGRERSRHFGRKVDAQRWLDEVTTSILTGLYADPKAGRVTFDSYCEGWASRQVWVRATRLSFNRAVATVPFGGLPIRSVRTSHVEAWVQKQVASGLAASTIGVRFQQVRSVFRAAIRDKVIAFDPCGGVRLPRKRRAEAAMAIPSPEQVGLLLGVGSPFPRIHGAVRLRRSAQGRGCRRPGPGHRLPAAHPEGVPTVAAGRRRRDGDHAPEVRV